ncbi:hypothetical protein BDR22DRAFT_836063 [Usnea florida]
MGAWGWLFFLDFISGLEVFSCSLLYSCPWEVRKGGETLIAWISKDQIRESVDLEKWGFRPFFCRDYGRVWGEDFGMGVAFLWFGCGCGCCCERGVGDIGIGMGAGGLSCMGMGIDIGIGIGIGIGMNTDLGSCGCKFGF